MSIAHEPAVADAMTVTAQHDERAVDSVIATLTNRHPKVDPRDIALMVHGGFAEFNGAKVTTFVPVLVLRACQERLRRI